MSATSRTMTRLLTTIVAAAAMLAVLLPTPAFADGSVTLGNGCSISYDQSRWGSQAATETNEINGCEAIQVEMYYYDPNDSRWELAVDGYQAGSPARVQRYTDRDPQYSDHNGEAGGSFQGIRDWW